MTKMTQAQRKAALEAHTSTGVPRGMFSLFVRTATFRAMVRNGWAQGVSVFGGNVTTAGLLAAGVDMDAIHGEALYEESVRELDRAALEQASPRARHFNAAVREGKSYRAAIDLLHGEALAEYREVTRAARQADSAAYQRSLAEGVQCGCTLNPLGHSRGECPARRAAGRLNRELAANAPALGALLSADA